jgi:hypothetical protein
VDRVERAAHDAQAVGLRPGFDGEPGTRVGQPAALHGEWGPGVDRHTQGAQPGVHVLADRAPGDATHREKVGVVLGAQALCQRDRHLLGPAEVDV